MNTTITFNEWFEKFEQLIRNAGFTGYISRESAMEDWQREECFEECAKEFIEEYKELCK